MLMGYLKDESLHERTALGADEISEPLELCLKSTYFRYEGKYYEQKEGGVMDSPVSAVQTSLHGGIGI